MISGPTSEPISDNINFYSDIGVKNYDIGSDIGVFWAPISDHVDTMS
jgi:hypothetical protein